ncbi:MAG: hypothetical protein ISS70_26930 [Phycisphaerae bacterium]|nr:hypothetical protein [Phycisphaerae bacterium]
MRSLRGTRTMAKLIEPSTRPQVAALVLVCAACLAIDTGCRYAGARGPDSTNVCTWTMDEFMISHWGSPKDEKSLKLFLGDHINTVIAVPEEVEFCRKHALKVLLAAPGEEAAHYLGDPIVWGYFIIDEPARKKIEYSTLVPRFRRHHDLDPTKPAYINLNREDDVEKFVEMFEPRVLSYDYYQWWEGQEEFFALLERFRRAALAADIPLICWVEAVVVPSGPIPADNQAKIRQSVYCSLAYGVKGIQWWAWRNFNRDAGAVNAELKRLGPVLVKLRSVNVFHTAPVPEGTRAIPNGHWVQSPTKQLVVGLLQDRHKNDFILLANRDHSQSQDAVLRFTRPLAAAKKMDKRTGQWVTLDISKEKDAQETTLHLPAGDGELLKIEWPF